ncbi:MAG TPA: type II toxin-antitoxin system VapC family toxin [Terracidiphilus sp.]|jgi:PIN domain nuclease of toxin-antitoxin system|nr:type II toxin-antitoxin system VapC family toxin [Terracidiphilus sp.]
MILLDTHVVIWLMMDAEQLSVKVREAIVEARIEGESLAYSPLSLYEIAYAAGRKRLRLNSGIPDFIAAIEARLESLPLTTPIVICAAELPEPFHGDPIDRVIAATAIVHGCTLATHDLEIRRSGVCKTLW